MNVFFAFAVFLATSAPVQPVQVSFCELTGHAERYHSQLVAVRAMFHFDRWILYDAKCAGRDHWVNVAFPDSETRIANRILDFESKSRSGIIKGKFIGRFRGPKGFGYGHLSGKRLEIQLVDASDLRRVRRPKLPDREAPSRWYELYKATEKLGQRLGMATWRQRDMLRDTLSEDYVAILPGGELLAGQQAVDSLILPDQEANKAREAKGMASSYIEVRPWFFSIDPQTAVLISRVSLIDAPDKKWEYVHIVRKTGSRWRLAFSRFTRPASRLHPDR